MTTKKTVTYSIDNKTRDRITMLCCHESMAQDRTVSRSELVRIAVKEKFERDLNGANPIQAEKVVGGKG